MMKKTLCALALVAATFSAQAATVLSENFNDVAGLTAKGYTLRNDSTVGGTNGFYPGSAFTGQGGSGGYLEANYMGAPAGGTLDEWLITPLFSTRTGGTVSFYLQSPAEAGFFDTVQFGFSSGASLAASAFNLGSLITVPGGEWTLYTLNFDATNIPNTTGRFAIRYTGPADRSNTLGIDTLTVSVPEPTTTMMLGLGLVGLVAARRRKAQATV
jgi:hypothetical protein